MALVLLPWLSSVSAKQPNVYEEIRDDDDDDDDDDDPSAISWKAVQNSYRHVFDIFDKLHVSSRSRAGNSRSEHLEQKKLFLASLTATSTTSIDQLKKYLNENGDAT